MKTFERSENRIQFDNVSLMNCVLKDEFGAYVRVSKLWRKQTAILIFVRHFACTACRAHVMQVWSRRKELQAGGAEIFFIGNGSPSAIVKFKAEMKIADAKFLTDEDLLCFQAAGFKRGFLSTLGPTSLKNGIRLIRRGFKQNRPTPEDGDVWQLGGVMVVQQNGNVIYHYISTALGDFPPESDILV